MKIIRHPKALAEQTSALCLAAGFFDGVHRGHQRVLGTAIRLARDIHGRAWVMTFDVHPSRILCPAASPPLITSTSHKLRLLEEFGIDGCLLLPFSKQLARLEPESFLDTLWNSAPSLKAFVVGNNWRFGNKGRGDLALLRRCAGKKHITVTAVAPTRHDGMAVSSTRIRHAIMGGDLPEAAIMLGRPFSILGRVVAGRHIGRTLGFPTANLVPDNEVRPPVGVYAVYAIAGNTSYNGVLNFGYRPTFGDDSPEPVMELHLLDMSGNLYRRTIEVFLIRRLRSERRFSSRDSLRRQMVRDTEHAREILSETSAKKLWKKTLQAWHSHIILHGK